MENKFAKEKGEGGREIDKDRHPLISKCDSSPWLFPDSVLLDPKTFLFPFCCFEICLIFLFIIINAQLPPAPPNMASASHLMTLLVQGQFKCS